MIRDISVLTPLVSLFFLWCIVACMMIQRRDLGQTRMAEGLSIRACSGAVSWMIDLVPFVSFVDTALYRSVDVLYTFWTGEICVF